MALLFNRSGLYLRIRLCKHVVTHSLYNGPFYQGIYRTTESILLFSFEGKSGSRENLLSMAPDNLVINVYWGFPIGRETLFTIFLFNHAFFELRHYAINKTIGVIVFSKK